MIPIELDNETAGKLVGAVVLVILGWIGGKPVLRAMQGRAVAEQSARAAEAENETAKFRAGDNVIQQYAAFAERERQNAQEERDARKRERVEFEDLLAKANEDLDAARKVIHDLRDSMQPRMAALELEYRAELERVSTKAIAESHSCQQRTAALEARVGEMGRDNARLEQQIEVLKAENARQGAQITMLIQRNSKTDFMGTGPVV